MSEPPAIRSNKDTSQQAALQFWRRATILGLCLAILLGFIGFYSVPGSLLHTKLATENGELHHSVAELNQALPRLDKIHQRLLMYETQLQAISEIKPDTTLNSKLLQDKRDHEPVFGHGQSDEKDTGLEDSKIGPETQVANWVDSVLIRIQKLEDSFSLVEPNLNLMVAELEDFDALLQAIPNRWPILGIHGSPFGWRKNPVTKQRLFHKGIDISAKHGTPIFSTAPGTILRSGWMQGYGLAVDIQHGFGILTRYAHCSRTKVKKGDIVERGDLIGWVGETGRATGPHVHFEIRIDNEPVDPTEFLGH